MTAAIRTAIGGVLAGVAGIGVVHTSRRHTRDAGRARALFVPPGSDQVHTWMVGRVARRVASPALGRRVLTCTWQIEGYRAFDDDGGEAGFAALVDAVCAAFAVNETLGGAVHTTCVEGWLGLQIEEEGPYTFAGVLCHGARGLLFTRSWE